MKSNKTGADNSLLDISGLSAGVLLEQQRDEMKHAFLRITKEILEGGPESTAVTNV